MPEANENMIGLALDDDQEEGLLPDWYMPFAGGAPLTGWRRKAALLIIASFLALTAAGLCTTYGSVGLF